MRINKARAIAAALTIAASSVVAGVVAQPAYAYTYCNGCEGAQFRSDGVNIRSCPSISCTSLGLGYKSQPAEVYCTQDPYENGWVHVGDLVTGVSGWSAQQYVLWGCD